MFQVGTKFSLTSYENKKSGEIIIQLCNKSQRRMDMFWSSYKSQLHPCHWNPSSFRPKNIIQVHTKGSVFNSCKRLIPGFSLKIPRSGTHSKYYIQRPGIYCAPVNSIPEINSGTNEKIVFFFKFIKLRVTAQGNRK